MPITSTWTTPSSLDRAIGDLLTETIWDQTISNELYLWDSVHNAARAIHFLSADSDSHIAINGAAPAWGTGAKAYQLNTYYALWVPSSTTGAGIGILANVYYDGANYKYIGNGTGDHVLTGGGTFQYFNAPSGSAAGTVTFAQRLLINATGTMLLGDSSNAGMTQGLTINQGASDDEILSLKSSDVAHGVTSITETDTYFLIAKGTTTQGSPVLDGFSSGTTGITVQGIHTTDNSTRGTSAQGVVNIVGLLKSGTGTAALGTNANIMVVQDGGLARFLVDKEGDIHMDATSNINAWDDHDDLALLESYRVVTAAPPDYKLRFATDVAAHARVLHETGVITLNDDGHHFVSVKGMFGLLIDALRQSRARVDALESRLGQRALGGG